MLSSGRKRDLVWLNFDEITNTDRKGKRCKCKKCGKEMEGQVMRMKQHIENCIKKFTTAAEEEIDLSSDSTSNSADVCHRIRIMRSTTGNRYICHPLPEQSEDGDDYEDDEEYGDLASDARQATAINQAGNWPGIGGVGNLAGGIGTAGVSQAAAGLGAVGGAFGQTTGALNLVPLIGPVGGR